MLYIVSGARSRCCILSQELGVGAVYCLKKLGVGAVDFSEARSSCCILSQEQGIGALYYFWS